MDQSNLICAPDLFGLPAVNRTARATRRRSPVELQVAGALCRQLQRKSGRREKQRIAHLICLNLVSLLKSRRQTERVGNG
jgi:hypothetical protein